MTPERYQQVKELFLVTHSLGNDERCRFLDDSSRNDPTLRAEVESILFHSDQSSGFLELPVLSIASARAAFFEDVSDEESLLVDQRLGPYRLVRLIASGGMGTVWLGERADAQFTKQVAIKLIKRGMDTDEILARFRNERQLLANLEHPNLARLLDGGVSAEGRPYLVMEYVDGFPIDVFCEEHALSVTSRLELFCKVCSAVEFAHQHLIVHRDLKPRNIFVAVDGTPKLLDFGIAKLLNPDNTSQATFSPNDGTSFFTPEYASPEQVLGEPITTASDVYSLGVVLYKLLTGGVPNRVTTRDRVEMIRVVCEVQPIKPSCAIELANHTSTKSVRAYRSRLAGDLDTIVLTALQKEPRRRYASVEQLSGDIRNHLQGLPVRARPDTLWYRSSKFIKRNAFGVTAATSVLVAILAGLGASTYLYFRANSARDEARKKTVQVAAVNDFLQEMLGAANPMTTRKPGLTVREVLDDAAGKIEAGSLGGQPEVEAEARLTIGNTYRFLGEYAAAEPQLRKALDICRVQFGPIHASVAECLRHLAKLLQARGDLAGAELLHREALSIMRTVLVSPNPEVAQAINDLAKLMQIKGDAAESDQLFREALAMRKKLPGDTAVEVAETLNDWAVLKDAQGDTAGAASLMRESLIIFRKKFGNEHPSTATSMHNLAELLKYQGDYAGAVPLHREALAIRRKLLGDEHPHVALSKRDLGDALRMMGDDAAAEPLLREALDTQRRVLGPQHYEVGTTLANLSSLLMERGDYAAAEPMARDALEVYRNAFGPDHAYTAAVLYRVAELRIAQHDLTEGEQLHRDALVVRRAKLPPGHADIALSLIALGSVLVDLDRPDEAEVFLKEAVSIASNPAQHVDPCVGWAKSGLGACLAAQHRYNESEPLLVAGYGLLKQDSIMSSHLRHERVRKTLERIVGLYEKWNVDAPNTGMADKVSEWRNSLLLTNEMRLRSDGARDR